MLSGFFMGFNTDMILKSYVIWSLITKAKDSVDHLEGITG